MYQAPSSGPIKLVSNSQYGRFRTAPEPHWLTIVTYVFVMVTCFAILLTLGFAWYEYMRIIAAIHQLKGTL